MVQLKQWIFKEENMYEYINESNDNNMVLYKNSPYNDIIKYIPGNRINNRLSVSKNDLNYNIIPSNNTIVGGFLIFISIIYYSFIIQGNRRFIALN